MAEDIKTTETVETVAKKTTAKRKAPAKKPAAKKPAAKQAAAKTETAESTAKKLAERAQDVSRQVLMANLGFYGKVFDQAQEQFGALKEQLEARRGQASDLYAELVKRGESVEADAVKFIDGIDLSKLKELADREALEAKLKELTDREALEARLEQARERFAELKASVGFKTAA
jgi:hypothetical protein